MKPGISVEIPGAGPLRISHVVFDFNGTLATDGKLLRGVAGRLRRLARLVEPIVLTADTFGTARKTLAGLPVRVHVVGGGGDKRRTVRALGRARVAAVGNGANDAPMFADAALAIVVCGAEGASTEALFAADIAVRDINDGIDLLLHPKRIVASLRS